MGIRRLSGYHYFMGGSWENHKKNTKKCDFWVSRPPIVGLATSILSVHGICWEFLWYILKNLTKSTFLNFQKLFSEFVCFFSYNSRTTGPISMQRSIISRRFFSLGFRLQKFFFCGQYCSHAKCRKLILFWLPRIFREQIIMPCYWVSTVL